MNEDEAARTPLVADDGEPLKPSRDAPPDKPALETLTNPWALASLALPLASFASGFSGAIADVPIKYYFYDTLGLGASQYYLYSAVTSIPSNLVVLVGLLADCAPLRGKRCKYYIAIGRVAWCATYLRLATSKTLGFAAITWYSTAGALGDTLASSMGAMLIVDRVKLEPEGRRGLFQATCMLASGVGKVAGQVAAAVTYGNDLHVPGFGDGFSIAAIFAIVALVPTLLVVPLLPALHEPDTRGADVREPIAELATLFGELARPAIYVPTLAFVITNLLIVDNEWHSVMLIDGCGPDVFTYAMLKVVQVTLMALATWAWRSTSLFYADFRHIILGAFFVYQFFKYSDALGVHLVGGPWRPDKCIAWLGADDVAFDAASTVLGDASTIIVVLLCRGRRTGLLYLLLASITGTAGSLGGIACMYLGAVWPISDANLIDGDYANYIKLQFLATSISMLAAPFFWYMLPGSREQLREVRPRARRATARAGAARSIFEFVLVTTTSPSRPKTRSRSSVSRPRRRTRPSPLGSSCFGSAV